MNTDKPDLSSVLCGIYGSMGDSAKDLIDDELKEFTQESLEENMMNIISWHFMKMMQKRNNVIQLSNECSSSGFNQSNQEDSLLPSTNQRNGGSLPENYEQNFGIQKKPQDCFKQHDTKFVDISNPGVLLSDDGYDQSDLFQKVQVADFSQLNSLECKHDPEWRPDRNNPEDYKESEFPVGFKYQRKQNFLDEASSQENDSREQTGNPFQKKTVSDQFEFKSHKKGSENLIHSEKKQSNSENFYSKKSPVKFLTESKLSRNYMDECDLEQKSFTEKKIKKTKEESPPSYIKSAKKYLIDYPANAVLEFGKSIVRTFTPFKGSKKLQLSVVEEAIDEVSDEESEYILQSAPRNSDKECQIGKSTARRFMRDLLTSQKKFSLIKNLPQIDENECDSKLSSHQNEITKKQMSFSNDPNFEPILFNNSKNNSLLENSKKKNYIDLSRDGSKGNSKGMQNAADFEKNYFVNNFLGDPTRDLMKLEPTLVNPENFSSQNKKFTFENTLDGNQPLVFEFTKGNNESPMQNAFMKVPMQDISNVEEVFQQEKQIISEYEKNNADFEKMPKSLNLGVGNTREYSFGGKNNAMFDFSSSPKLTYPQLSQNLIQNKENLMIEEKESPNYYNNHDPNSARIYSNTPDISNGKKGTQHMYDKYDPDLAMIFSQPPDINSDKKGHYRSLSFGMNGKILENNLNLEKSNDHQPKTLNHNPTPNKQKDLNIQEGFLEKQPFSQNNFPMFQQNDVMNNNNFIQTGNGFGIQGNSQKNLSDDQNFIQNGEFSEESSFEMSFNSDDSSIEDFGWEYACIEQQITPWQQDPEDTQKYNGFNLGMDAIYEHEDENNSNSNAFMSKRETKKEVRAFCMGKKIPKWATEKAKIHESVLNAKENKQYTKVFKKLAPERNLDQEQILGKETLKKNYEKRDQSAEWTPEQSDSLQVSGPNSGKDQSNPNQSILSDNPDGLFNLDVSMRLKFN